MRSDGARLLTFDGPERIEPVITYKRLPSDSSGRIEPRFAGEPSGRGLYVEDIEALPRIEAPPSDASLDATPAAEGAPRAEVREVRRSRGPRLAMAVGILALVAGAGVLAATFGGAMRLDGAGTTPTPAIEATGEDTVAALQPDGADASTGTVRVVPLAGTQTERTDALVGGIATGIDAPAAEAPGVIVANPPLPRPRPATASANPPQPEATDAEIQAASAAPDNGAEVDGLMASVDRVLAEEKARTASIAPASPSLDPYAQSGAQSGLYGPPAPGAGVQPLPYPPLAPLPGAADPQLYPGDDLAADTIAPDSPWWLPQRRVVDTGDNLTPPAEIPNAGSGTYGTW